MDFINEIYSYSWIFILEYKFEILFNEYGLGLFLLNICIYTLLVSTIFLIFIVFKYQDFSTINLLSYLSNDIFLFFVFTVTLLSLAGIPPLVGFFGKWLYLMYLMSLNSFFFLVLTVMVNLFILYFYIQTMRFSISLDRVKSLKPLKEITGNTFITVLLLISLWVNISGACYVTDLFTYLSFWSIFL